MISNNWTKLAERIDSLAARSLRTAARSLFNASNAVPVTVSADVTEPTIHGNRGGHFTRGGDRIHSPSAYSRFGWSNMVYRSSTLEILIPPTFGK